MSFKQVLKIAEKFVRKADVHSELEKYRAQKAQLENFALDMRNKSDAILNEMLFDLRVLKEKKFDKDMWHTFAQLYRALKVATTDIDSKDPYKSAHKIINFINHHRTQSVIGNLEFMIKNYQTYLEKSNVSFKDDQLINKDQIRSLRLTKGLAKYLANYIKNNPLLPEPNFDLSGVSMAEPKVHQTSEPEDVTNPGKK